MEYQHGGDIYSHRVHADYSANINPLGLPKGVRTALIRGIEICGRYPDSRCAHLKKALAEFHQVPEQVLICGNGAADLIFQLAAAVRPRRAMVLAPSFLEYEQALRQTGCELAYFDLQKSQGFSLSVRELCKELERWKASAGEKSQSGEREDVKEAGEGGLTDILFLCNPNNPTGLTVEKGQLKQLLDFCRDRRIFCAVDECFNEFLDEPGAYSVLEAMRQERYENVFLLKAFTKIYAMAGIRLGYGMCWNADILNRMEAGRQPWTVSTLAQEAGVAALKETAYVKEARKVVGEERAFMKKRMEEIGFFVYPSMANYLFFSVPDIRSGKGMVWKEEGERGWLYDACLSYGVLIRSCFNYRGLSNHYYRVCVRKREENQRFLVILQKIMEERKR